MVLVRCRTSYADICDGGGIGVDSGGYPEKDGKFMFFDDIATKDTVVVYFPGRRDILFKRFDWNWTPNWLKRRDLLMRRFEI